MRYLQISALVFLTCLSVSSNFVIAEEEADPIIFYRDGNGVVDRDSVSDARVMAHIARRQGFVNLFVTSDFPFDLNFDEMTLEEIEDQNSRAADYMAETLAEAIASGHVWLPAEGQNVFGPGCRVQATPRGLKALLRDERLVQVVATDPRPSR